MCQTFIQDESWLVDITADDEFLGLYDKKLMSIWVLFSVDAELLVFFFSIVPNLLR